MINSVNICLASQVGGGVEGLLFWLIKMATVFCCCCSFIWIVSIKRQLKNDCISIWAVLHVRMSACWLFLMISHFFACQWEQNELSKGSHCWHCSDHALSVLDSYCWQLLIKVGTSLCSTLRIHTHTAFNTHPTINYYGISNWTPQNKQEVFWVLCVETKI